MRFEIAVRTAMVAVIPALIVLILVTPGLMGRPSVLSAIPILIVGLTDANVVIDVHGAVDHYRYRTIIVIIEGQDNVSARYNGSETETFDVDMSIPRSATAVFDLSVLVANREGTTFALNATVFTGTDEVGDFVSLTDRDTMRTTIAYAPADFRTLIPAGRGP